MQMRSFSLLLDPEPGVFQMYFLLFASPAALEASTAFEDAPEDLIHSDIFSSDSVDAGVRVAVTLSVRSHAHFITVVRTFKSHVG